MPRACHVAQTLFRLVFSLAFFSILQRNTRHFVHKTDCAFFRHNILVGSPFHRSTTLKVAGSFHHTITLATPPHWARHLTGHTTSLATPPHWPHHLTGPSGRRTHWADELTEQTKALSRRKTMSYQLSRSIDGNTCVVPNENTKQEHVGGYGSKQEHVGGYDPEREHVGGCGPKREHVGGCGHLSLSLIVLRPSSH
jgi:hypothetical protein